MVSWDIDYPKLEWNFGDFDLEKVECEDFQVFNNLYLDYHSPPPSHPFIPFSFFLFSFLLFRRIFIFLGITPLLNYRFFAFLLIGCGGLWKRKEKIILFYFILFYFILSCFICLCFFLPPFSNLDRQWMLFDILTANYIQGSLNNCLFNLSESDPLEEPKPLSSSPSPSPSASSRKITIDPSMPQLEDDEVCVCNHARLSYLLLSKKKKKNTFLFLIFSPSPSHLSSPLQENNEAEEKYEADNYTTREFKLHQLPIDLLTAGTTGPLSWITSGFVCCLLFAVCWLLVVAIGGGEDDVYCWFTL